MKCVRLVGQGVPIRTTNEKARQIVEVEHDGEYCAKKFFEDWWVNSTDENHKAKVMTQYEKDRASVATFTPPSNKHRSQRVM